MRIRYQCALIANVGSVRITEKVCRVEDGGIVEIIVVVMCKETVVASKVVIDPAKVLIVVLVDWRAKLVILAASA